MPGKLRRCRGTAHAMLSKQLQACETMDLDIMINQWACTDAWSAVLDDCPLPDEVLICANVHSGPWRIFSL